MPDDSAKKPTVVGLYGISGCGKTYLLDQLKHSLDDLDQYIFYEGSEVLASAVPDGLPAFIELPREAKTEYREKAINKIANECAAKDRVGVVTGHFMFWHPAPTGSGSREQVITPADLATYTHVIYLDIPIDSVVRNRRDDAVRGREWMSPNVLLEWQRTEKRDLHRLCMDYEILFSFVQETPDYRGTLPEIVTTMLADFRNHNPDINLARAKVKMDEYLLHRKGQIETVLVMDGDRTLIDKDTGRQFWKMVQASRTGNNESQTTVDAIFSGPMGYSYIGFRQATLLYEEIARDLDFDRLCRKVQEQVNIDKKFVNLLKQAALQPHVAAVVVTSGLGRLWDSIVEKVGLSDSVKVIGGGRISDGFVVTAEVKAALVDHLQSVYNVHITAFGDSPLDLPMLRQADDAIVVVCPDEARSKTMDTPLLYAINNGLNARQSLLIPGAHYRLDTLTLPSVHLAHQATMDHLLARRSLLSRPTPCGQASETSASYTAASDIPASKVRLRLLHATDRPSSKVLTAPARDAALAGPALRDVHFRIGQYLATELVTEIVGLEEFPIRHVQGHHATGHRLRNEARTTVVAILRGGEPMAFGVSASFPLAMFVHAKEPEDLRADHVRGQSNVILVDSVVNNGKTVIEFVQHLKTLSSTLKNVVVVAGVVQAGAVAENGPIVEALDGYEKLSVVALRLSTNKYTGRGVTDTGNRLFNTTQLE
ncbi:uracil phosphoribosyltransferase-domain-containing protein [Coniochaeta sp. 2T2.1]|nr:uracil phosphoribosyltransferase-domain-containing protein [Coniochaeta sp. 2T2.1]